MSEILNRNWSGSCRGEE